jgi:uncharacterized membrane protein
VSGGNSERDAAPVSVRTFTGVTPRTDIRSLSPADRVLPSRTEPLARYTSRLIGGGVGRHAVIGRHWFWTPLRAILLIAVALLICGYLTKAPCAQTYLDSSGTRQLDWRDSKQYTAMCYSDTIPLYTAERLDQGGFPFRTSWIDNPETDRAQVRYMEYPVLTGLFQWLNAKLTNGYLVLASTGSVPSTMPVVVYFDLTVLWLTAAWLITIWAVVGLTRRRKWDAAIAAASPLVAVHVFTNFDPLATAFAAAGMLAWARRRPGLAGVLLGLGAAAKLYPLFLLGPMLVLCLRTGQVGVWTRTALAGVLAWLAVNVPIALAYPAGWREFFRLNTERGVDPDSIYNVINYFTGWKGFDGVLDPGRTPTVLNAVTATLFLTCCVGIAWVGLTAPRRPRLAQLVFLVVAAFLLTNKVWSPQYSLWLVPLAVLALPRWRLLLVWMTVDALVWVPRMLYYLGEDKKGLPQDYFLATVVVRDLLVVAICMLIIREIYRPDLDPVRRAGDDDPTGGVLENAPDRPARRVRPDGTVSEPTALAR